MWEGKIFSVNNFLNKKNLNVKTIFLPSLFSCYQILWSRTTNMDTRILGLKLRQFGIWAIYNNKN